MVLSKIDLFGKSIPITYNQRGTKTKTAIGGLYTLISFIVIGVITYSKVLKLINREGDSVQSRMSSSFDSDFG